MLNFLATLAAAAGGAGTTFLEPIFVFGIVGLEVGGVGGVEACSLEGLVGDCLSATGDPDRFFS